MVMDQVCGCEVDETAAQFKSEHGGKTYFFCTAGCKAKFDSDPQRWVKEPAVKKA
jgi:Cu+-exporting ATPase